MSDLQTKLGDGLFKLQDSVQQGKLKMQTTQEINQYKKEIQLLVNSRSDIILRLGEDAYRKIRTGELSDQQLCEYSHDIAELDRKIYKAQCALEILIQKNEIQTCSNCGSVITNGDKFCGSCGQKQEDKTILTSQSQLIECPACMEQIPATANFCPSCGISRAI